MRGDLIRIIGGLMRRRDRFDHILIETTGLRAELQAGLVGCLR